jgi:hypothetical protein
MKMTKTFLLLFFAVMAASVYGQTYPGTPVSNPVRTYTQNDTKGVWVIGNGAPIFSPTAKMSQLYFDYMNQTGYFWNGSAWVAWTNDFLRTASNGLTEDGSDVKLGGTLNEATTIDLDGNDFIIEGTGTFGVNITGDIALLNTGGIELRPDSKFEVHTLGNIEVNAAQDIDIDTDDVINIQAVNGGSIIVDNNDFVLTATTGNIQINSPATIAGAAGGIAYKADNSNSIAVTDYGINTTTGGMADDGKVWTYNGTANEMELQTPGGGVEAGDIVAYVSLQGSNDGVINSLSDTWIDPWEAAKDLSISGYKKATIFVFPGKYKQGDPGCTDCDHIPTTVAEASLWAVPDMQFYMSEGAVIVDSVSVLNSSLFAAPGALEDTVSLEVSGEGVFIKITNLLNTSNGGRQIVNDNIATVPVLVKSVGFKAKKVICSGGFLNLRRTKYTNTNVDYVNTFDAIGNFMINGLATTDSIYASLNYNVVEHCINSLTGQRSVWNGAIGAPFYRFSGSANSYVTLNINTFRGIGANLNEAVICSYLSNGSFPTQLNNFNVTTNIGTAICKYVFTDTIAIATNPFLRDTTNGSIVLFSQTLGTLTNSKFIINCENCISDGLIFRNRTSGTGTNNLDFHFNGNYTSKNYSGFFLQQAGLNYNIWLNGTFKAALQNIAIDSVLTTNAFRGNVYVQGNLYTTGATNANITTRKSDVLNLQFCKLVAAAGATNSVDTDTGSTKVVNVISSFANKALMNSAPAIIDDTSGSPATLSVSTFVK